MRVPEQYSYHILFDLERGTGMGIFTIYQRKEYNVINNGSSLPMMESVQQCREALIELKIPKDEVYTRLSYTDVPDDNGIIIQDLDDDEHILFALLSVD